MTPNPDNNMDGIYYSFMDGLRMEPSLYELYRGHLRTTLARFGLNLHWLHIRQLRFQQVPYENRWCPCCSASSQRLVVDSEEHALFHCPLYADIRQAQPWADSGACSTLVSFMGLAPLQQARFVHACYERYLGQV